MRRICTTFAIFALCLASLCGADQMRERQITVVGTKLRFALHPSAAEPSVAPEGVAGANIPRPDGIRTFVRATYDYKDGGKLGRDGAVTVVGTLWRRGAKEVAAGISFRDVDALLRYLSVGTEKQLRKVERDGRMLICRTGGSGRKGDPEGDITLEWLVPVSDEFLIMFLVDLQHFGPAKKSPAKWPAAARALQQRIFDSFHVE